MSQKIVLSVDDQENLCSFMKAHYLKLLKQTKENQWQSEDLIPLNLTVENTEELRANTKEAISMIQNCNILVSQGITGIPYYVFDKMGYAIFEATSYDNNLLNEIILEVEKNREELKEDSLLPRQPIEITDGNYFLDFFLLEKKHPELTTKQVLLPFFDTTPFMSLSIRISHLPPWLEFGEYAQKFDIMTKNLDEAIMVILSPKSCER